MKKIVSLVFCGLIACSFLLPNSLYARTPTKHSISQRQADIKKLHGVVISVMGKQALNDMDDKAMQQIIDNKINALPSNTQKEIRDYLNRYIDPTGMDQALYVVYWYMADTLHQRLLAMPKLQTPEIERLRQKWIADMQSIDDTYARKKPSSTSMDDFIKEVSNFFEKNGLEVH